MSALKPITQDDAKNIARLDGMRSAFLNEYAHGRRSAHDLLLLTCAMHDALMALTERVSKLDTLRVEVTSAVAHFSRP